jgi:hypothetical protein
MRGGAFRIYCYGLPADAFGAYRPNPQATTKLAPRLSSLKGYQTQDLSLDRQFSFLYIQATAKRVLINQLPEWFWFFDPLS